jgi:hypothetical protein
MAFGKKKAKKPKLLRKVAADDGNALVKTTTARYTKILKNGADSSHKREISKMAASAEKPRPNNVPEENVYNKTHWLLIITYLVAAIAVFLLISNAG